MTFPLKTGSSHRPRVVIAVDLGGTHLRAAVVDEAGQILFRLKHKTPQTTNSDEIVRIVVSATRDCEMEKTKCCAEIVAVSVLVPGTVDSDNSTVMTAPNLPSLNGFSMKAALENKLDWPVMMENDANAAAIGEAWVGAGRGLATIICVTLGTGVGGGIVLDGKLWRGVDGSAGEIGHTSVDPFSSVACKCGNTGCLEVFASATAIVRMTREGLIGNSGSMLQGVELSSETIHQAALKGDELAREVFAKMGTYLGIGLANLINLFNPEIIVIGGGVANGWELFEKHVREQVSKRAFPIPARRVKIVPAECGDDAGLLGAARLAFTARRGTIG